jgi:hypothetical protein
MSRTPHDPLFQTALFDAAIACFIHSFMPARGPADAPSLLPVYGRELGLVLAVATTELHVFRV